MWCRGWNAGTHRCQARALVLNYTPCPLVLMKEYSMDRVCLQDDSKLHFIVFYVKESLWPCTTCSSSLVESPDEGRAQLAEAVLGTHAPREDTTSDIKWMQSSIPAFQNAPDSHGGCEGSSTHHSTFTCEKFYVSWVEVELWTKCLNRQLC